MASPRAIKNPEQDRATAWEDPGIYASKKMRSGELRLFGLDELVYVFSYQMLPVETFLAEYKSIRASQPALHIVVTGRDAPEELIAAADLVTEMKEIKHPFNAGILAQQGIEF